MVIEEAPTAQAATDQAPPQLVEWRFSLTRDPSQERHYQQAELSMAEEARILGLARQVGTELTTRDMDWQRFEKLFDDPFADPEYVMFLLQLVEEVAPGLLAEFCLTCFGILPVNVDRTPNEKYAGERDFLMQALNLRKASEVLSVFLAQNDYRRVASPFFELVRAGRTTTRPTTASTSPGENGSTRSVARTASSSKPGTARPKRRSKGG